MLRADAVIFHVSTGLQRSHDVSQSSFVGDIIASILLFGYNWTLLPRGEQYPEQLEGLSHSC